MTFSTSRRMRPTSIASSAVCRIVPSRRHEQENSRPCKVTGEGNARYCGPDRISLTGNLSVFGVHGKVCHHEERFLYLSNTGGGGGSVRFRSLVWRLGMGN